MGKENTTLVVGDCLKKIPNQYVMTLVAARRAKDLKKGAEPRVALKDPKEKFTTTALNEIAAGEIGVDYLINK